MLVTAASVQDNVAGQHLLTAVATHHPTVRKAWADMGYKIAVIEHGAALGIDIEIVRRNPATRGFAIQPRRWVVERSLIHVAMIGLMTRRLTGENTPTWRGT